jgi:hypothetical protein
MISSSVGYLFEGGHKCSQREMLMSSTGTAIIEALAVIIRHSNRHGGRDSEGLTACLIIIRPSHVSFRDSYCDIDGLNLRSCSWRQDSGIPRGRYSSNGLGSGCVSLSKIDYGRCVCHFCVTPVHSCGSMASPSAPVYQRQHP